MSLKKVLIISYYWPPSGGSGVQRWLKMSKYLPEFGWEPIIVTPENPAGNIEDFSLQNDVSKNLEVHKFRIYEPYHLFEKFGKKKSLNQGNLIQKKKSFTQAVFEWLRGNVFLPDPRVTWVIPTYFKVLKLLKNNPDIKCVVSSGPPQSMHLIALLLKKKTGIKWIADFRDPWSFIDFYEHLPITKLAHKWNLYLEKSVLRRSDKQVIVTDSWAKRYESISGNKFNVITNGFDGSDFETSVKSESGKITLGYFGSLNEDRNIDSLWGAVEDLLATNEWLKSKFKIKFYGNISSTVFESVDKYNLSKYFVHEEYVKHSEVVKIMQQTTVLLLLINNVSTLSGIIPGKVYEYLASLRPILLIGPKEGDCSNIIRETGAGAIVDYLDKDGIKNALLSYFKDQHEGKNISNQNKDLVWGYSRKGQAEKYSDLLNEVIK